MKIASAAALGRMSAFAACVALVTTQALAQKPAEVHGSLDAYAGQGIVIAWGVLRAKDEAATEVVVRVEADPARFAALSVTGVDPFTKAAQSLLARTPIAGVYEYRSPRRRFADLPRTEWRFFAPGTAADAPPALLVYFQGVPDTTPEFDDPARLQADLARRLERARSEAKAK